MEGARQAEREEQWRAVVGAEGYEVSDMGRVRSYRKPFGRRSETARVLKPTHNGPALAVTVIYPDGKKLRLVHRLVLEAFRGACPPGCEGCHNDGNPQNNCVENLRWDTHRNNLADRVVHNTLLKGEKHACSKLSDKDRETMRGLLERGFSMQRIADFYGVGTCTVRRAREAEGPVEITTARAEQEERIRRANEGAG